MLDLQGTIGYLTRQNDKHLEEIRQLRKKFEVDNEPSAVELPVCADKPYIKTVVTTVHRRYNLAYGADRECVCGHAYYRHFDPYEGNEAVGCKYCGCGTFIEKAKSD